MIDHNLIYGRASFGRPYERTALAFPLIAVEAARQCLLGASLHAGGGGSARLTVKKSWRRRVRELLGCWMPEGEIGRRVAGEKG